tara:strand:- start:1326 stop:1751 length:426 start_codon:yes stop_codon:yes gene_type:complete
MKNLLLFAVLVSLPLLLGGCGVDNKEFDNEIIQGDAGSDVSGTWTTTFSGAVDPLGNSSGDSYASLIIKEMNNKVTGKYDSSGLPPGTIEGVLSGDTISGTWKDVNLANGTYQFKFDGEKKSFKGWWKSEDLKGYWNGVRK